MNRKMPISESEIVAAACRYADTRAATARIGHTVKYDRVAEFDALLQAEQTLLQLTRQYEKQHPVINGAATPNLEGTNDEHN